MMTGGPPKFSKKGLPGVRRPVEQLFGQAVKKFSKGIVKTDHLYA